MNLRRSLPGTRLGFVEKFECYFTHVHQSNHRYNNNHDNYLTNDLPMAKELNWFNWWMGHEFVYLLGFMCFPLEGSWARVEIRIMNQARVLTLRRRIVVWCYLITLMRKSMKWLMFTSRIPINSHEKPHSVRVYYISWVPSFFHEHHEFAFHPH